MSTTAKHQSPVDVFRYLDYRAYLRDHYTDRKEHGRGFSFRAFSKLAKLRSPNYLKLVMDSERNITPEMAARFADACGLRGEAAAYFCDLVGFTQAATSADRATYYERLTGFRRYRLAHELDVEHAAYHSTWYVPAIRELAARRDFVADPAWIAKRLWPQITKAEAARALDTLVSLGLLVPDERGRLRQGAPLVSTGAEAPRVHVASYHRTMLARAAEAIDLIPSAQRDISSLTLCLGPDGLAHLKERIQRFRRELLDLSTLEDDPRQVVQVNFQLFPLSHSDDDAAEARR